MSQSFDMRFIDGIDDMELSNGTDFRALDLFSTIRHWNTNEHTFFNTMATRLETVCTQQKKWSVRGLRKKRTYAANVIAREWRQYWFTNTHYRSTDN